MATEVFLTSGFGKSLCIFTAGLRIVNLNKFDSSSAYCWHMLQFRSFAFQFIKPYLAHYSQAVVSQPQIYCSNHSSSHILLPSRHFQVCAWIFIGPRNEGCEGLQEWGLVHLGIDEMSAAINASLASRWRRARFPNELRYKCNKEAITIFFDTWINVLFNIASVHYHPRWFMLWSIHKHIYSSPSQSPAIFSYKWLLFKYWVFHLTPINIWCNYKLPLIWLITFYSLWYLNHAANYKNKQVLP